ncbi:MAG: MFS transporter [Promethearchaeota archaeon]
MDDNIENLDEIEEIEEIGENDPDFSRNPVQYPPILHYYSFFLGQLISILGSGIVSFSLIWWIAVESGSALYLSFASFLVFGTKVIISPIAGVFADRWNRKTIIFTMDLLQALNTLVMIGLFFSQQAQIWNILLLMGIGSGFAAFQDPTVNAIIPVMVPKKNLSRINSLIYFSTFIMRMIGPMIGALLLSLWSINQILWLDCISFVIAAVPLLFISIPHVAKNNQKDGKSEKSREEGMPEELGMSKESRMSGMSGKLKVFKIEFKEGLKIIKIAGILGLTLVFPFSNLLETPKNILTPILFSDIYKSGPIIFAIVIAAAQLTAALTSLTLSFIKIPDKIPRQKIIVFGLIGIFTGSLIMIIPSEVPIGGQLGWKVVFLVSGAILMGFCSPIVNITMQTIVQKLVPPEKLGRVEGVNSALSLSLIPVGTLLTGFISELIGVRPIILYSGIIAICGIIIFYYATDFSNIDEKLSQLELES